MKKALEQRQQVMWPRTRFRMPLEAKSWLILERDALQRRVKQGAMSGLHMVRQAVLVYGKAVILARYHHLPRCQVLHRFRGARRV